MGVLGIGGIFFRANNPDALSLWYRDHLNVGAGCGGSAGGNPSEWYWEVEAGPVVFAPFAATTDYFPPDKAFMINLRVAGIDDLIASLTAAGIAVETRAEWDSAEVGRFARLYDPEGNAIELWQPPA